MKKLVLRIAKFLLFLLLILVVGLVASYRPDLSFESLVPKYTDEYSHFLNVDGINIHLKVKGEGEPIFLIHGSFSSLHTWEAWEDELSRYFMTISMDLPGHGLTGPDTQKRYGITDYAGFVLDIADQLNLQKFHVAGNSMGGAVALRLASEAPDRILTLNLVDAAGAPPSLATDSARVKSYNSGAWIFKVAQNPVFNKLLLKCTPKFLFGMNLKQVFADDGKITDEMLTRYYELLRRDGNRQATVDRLTGRKPYDLDFSKITMPVLIMWGAEDKWISMDNGKRLEKAIPRSTLKVFENVGHVPMEESPTETVAEYLAFLGVSVDRDYLSPKTYYSHVNRMGHFGHASAFVGQSDLADRKVGSREK